MAEKNDLRSVLEKIPVYGETGFAGVAAAHDSKNFKNKNQPLRLAGRASGFADWRQAFLASDGAPRKFVKYGF